MKLHREGFSILLSTILMSVGIVLGLSLCGVPNLVLYISSGVAGIVFILFAQFFSH